MTATVSASESASSWSWVTSRAVAPAARRALANLAAHLGAQAGVERRRRARRAGPGPVPAPAPAPAPPAAAGRRRAGVGSACSRPAEVDQRQQLARPCRRGAAPAAGRSRRWRRRRGGGRAHPPGARSRSPRRSGARWLSASQSTRSPSTTEPASACSKPRDQRAAASSCRSRTARGRRSGCRSATARSSTGEHGGGAEGLAQVGDRERGRAGSSLRRHRTRRRRRGGG